MSFTSRGAAIPAVIRIAPGWDDFSYEPQQDGEPSFDFVLTRTGDLATAQGVSWAVTGIGPDPADGTDFAGGVLPSGQVEFAPGEASRTVPVFLSADDTYENIEQFAFTLSAPTGGAVLGAASATALIGPDDAIMSVRAEAGYSDDWEGASGSRVLAFTVLVDRYTAISAGVRWEVVGSGPNPATADDFVGGVFPSGSVGWRSGFPNFDMTISVPVVGDGVAEGDEGFTVRLFNPRQGTTFLAASVEGLIRDDDGPEFQFRSEREVRGDYRSDDVAVIEGGLRDSEVLTAGGLPVRVTVGADGPGYALNKVEVLDFADGRLVFEPSDPAAQVARLYEAALGRAPDQAGLNFHVAALRAGRPLSEVAGNFAASPEFSARVGTGLSDAQYVEQLYAAVLGRGGSAAELGFHGARLAAGASRGQVLAGISESEENRALTAPLVGAGVWDRSENAVLVAQLYDAALSRAPDVGGLRFHRDALDANRATALDVASDLLGSPEFAARSGGGGLSNAGLVELLYRDALDRAASASEVAYYTSQLDSGALGRAQLVLNFSESPEHQALMAPSVASENPAQFGILFA